MGVLTRRRAGMDYKSETFDPFDAVMPSNQNFIVKHYAASAQREKFSYRAGSMGYTNKNGEFTYCTYGVEKRLARASGEGYLIESHWVGKSE